MEHSGDYFDDGALKLSIGDDEELFLELVDLFAEDAPKQIAALREALNAGDQRTAERAAHTLKGASANLCAGVVRARAAETEALCRDGDLDRAAATVEALEDAVGITLRLMRGDG